MIVDYLAVRRKVEFIGKKRGKYLPWNAESRAAMTMRMRVRRWARIYWPDTLRLLG